MGLPSEELGDDNLVQVGSTEAFNFVLIVTGT